VIFVAGETQEVFSKIESSFGKPSGTGKFILISEYLLPGLAGDDLAKAPDAGPEIFILINRPLMQLLVILEGDSVFAFDKANVVDHIGLVNACAVRLPEGR
jgi:hypothetical protein